MHNRQPLWCALLLLLLVCKVSADDSPSRCRQSIAGAGVVHNYIEAAGTNLDCTSFEQENSILGVNSRSWKCLDLNSTTSSLDPKALILSRYRSKANVRKFKASKFREGLPESKRVAISRGNRDFELPSSVVAATRWITSTVCHQGNLASSSPTLERRSFSRQMDFPGGSMGNNLEVVFWRCNSTLAAASPRTDAVLRDTFLVNLRTVVSHQSVGREKDYSWLIKVLENLEEDLHNILTICLERSDVPGYGAGLLVGRDSQQPRRLLRSSVHMTSYWRLVDLMDTGIGWLGLGLSLVTCCYWRPKRRRCWWPFPCKCCKSKSGGRQESPESGRDSREHSTNSRSVMRQNLDDATNRRRVEPLSFGGLTTATVDFDDENKLGVGTFGTVYRGLLFDGRVVAIKRNNSVKPMKEQKLRQIEAELETLSRLHHKHLVNMVGYCIEPKEIMLVYEYMKNGSLHDRLHKRRCSRALSSWKVRIRLALQAARGIEYLHTYAEQPIIHRDIKSSNILLDAKWSARVSDFGLSLIFPLRAEGAHIASMGGASGTLGYMDPEYHRLQDLTTISDVFSFGVVMLELLTGKKAIYEKNNGYASVVDYAVRLIQDGKLLSILDPRLPAPTVNDSAALQVMAEVAKNCVHLNGMDRPSMTAIVGLLEHAVGLSRPRHSAIPVFGSQIGSSSGPSSASSEQAEEDDVGSIDTDVAQLGSLSTEQFEAVLESLEQLRIPSSRTVNFRDPAPDSASSSGTAWNTACSSWQHRQAGRVRSSGSVSGVEAAPESDPLLPLQAGHARSSSSVSGVGAAPEIDPLLRLQASAIAGFTKFGDEEPPEDIDRASQVQQPQRESQEDSQQLVLSRLPAMSGTPTASASATPDIHEGGSDFINDIDIEDFLEEYSDEKPGSISYAGYSVNQDVGDLVRALEQENRPTRASSPKETET